MSTAAEIRLHTAKVRRRTFWIAVATPVVLSGLIFGSVAFSGTGDSSQQTALVEKASKDVDAAQTAAALAEKAASDAWAQVLTDASGLEVPRLQKERTAMYDFVTEAFYGSRDKAQAILSEHGVSTQSQSEALASLSDSELISSHTSDDLRFHSVLARKDDGIWHYDVLISFRPEGTGSATPGASSAGVQNLPAWVLRVDTATGGTWTDFSFVRAQLLPSYTP